MGLWAYFYLAFAFRLLRQIPLHLGFASYHDLGLNYWHFNNHELHKNDHQQLLIGLVYEHRNGTLKGQNLVYRARHACSVYLHAIGFLPHLFQTFNGLIMLVYYAQAQPKLKVT